MTACHPIFPRRFATPAGSPGVRPRLGKTFPAILGLMVAVATAAFLPVPPCAAESAATDSNGSSDAGAQSKELSPAVTVTSVTGGKTLFIKFVHLHLNDPSLLEYVQFTIAPKAGSVTRPLSARYSSAYLTRHGYVHTEGGEVTVPIFGLYQDYTNKVRVVTGLAGGVSHTKTLSIPTAHFGGGVYNHPTVIQARSASTALSYDFIMLKAFSSGYCPVVIDTDGEIRWVGTDDTRSMQSIFYHNSFFVVTQNHTTLRRMEFDGTQTDLANYAPLGVTAFHHNFDFGKYGIFTDVNTADYLESIIMEVDTAGQVLGTWNLADIITNAMLAGGDDPAKFVAAIGSQDDWFHNNSVTYRPSDDSIVISSRENFVIALDYETQAIKWILGDPTKQWYQFPSLRKYALTGTAGTNYPDGQHAVSFFRDKLLLFDNGYGSADHVPMGPTRTYSAPRKYDIDQAGGSATEIWNYRADELIFSPICGSVYEDRANNYLIDYATAGPYLDAEIVGLTPNGDKVFDYQFKEINTITTAWNATVMHLEDLVFN